MLATFSCVIPSLLSGTSSDLRHSLRDLASHLSHEPLHLVGYLAHRILWKAKRLFFQALF
jgi:hypothetical protein